MNEWKDRLRQALQHQPLGLTRAQLQHAVGATTAQQQQILRALRALETEGLVRFEGNTRARRYWARGEGAASTPGELPLSPEGRQALAQVSQPIHARAPVSYRREFLEAYRPGKTRYLAPAVLERLHAVGRTGSTRQPAGTYARHVLERFLLDLSWNSARLEGNTYSLLDTERLLSAGDAAEGKSALLPA